MPTKKVENFEEEMRQLGIRAHILNTERIIFSGKTRYESMVYFLTPRKGEDVIGKQLRASISEKADGIGLYAKFFEKDHFEGAAGKVARQGHSIEKGIVAVFIPKYPLSQIEKIAQDIQRDCGQSFDYLQEDVVAVNRMNHAKEVEKSVRNLTRTDPEFAVFAWNIQKSQLYLMSQEILGFYARVEMTERQQRIFRSTSYLLGNIF